MKKTFLLLAILITVVNYSNLSAQTYTTGFDNAGEQAGWTEYRAGVIDPFYEWEYSTFGEHSAPNCLIHNYPVGGTEASDDWFVSPAFDFSQGGTIDTVWHSFSGFGLPIAGDTVAIYVLNGSADPELATSKTLLFFFTDTNYVNDNTWRMKTNIGIPNLPGESFIAFRYKTIVNWLDVKFDDLIITENNITRLDFPVLNNSLLRIFPNPATDFLSIEIAEELTVKGISLFDIAGKEVRRFGESEKMLNLEGLKSGQYVLSISTGQGLLTKKVLIK